MKTLQSGSLKFPEISKNPKQNFHPETVDIEKDDLEHRLDDYVRLQYLRFVENKLNENYKLWLNSDTGQTSGLIVTQKEIRETAESIEIEALKGCTIVSLYRKEIIKMVKKLLSFHFLFFMSFVTFL